METLSALLAFYEGNRSAICYFLSLKVNNAELWCFVRYYPEKNLLDKQQSCWWFETQLFSCDVTVVWCDYRNIMYWWYTHLIPVCTAFCRDLFVWLWSFISVIGIYTIEMLPSASSVTVEDMGWTTTKSGKHAPCVYFTGCSLQKDIYTTTQQCIE